MKRMIRAAASAALLAGGLGSTGCVTTDTAGGSRGEGHGPIGDHWRNAVDPCYPERYGFAAREATIAPFAQQALNGHVLDQTIWNYQFEFGSDILTPAAIEKLNSLARTRPAPDPKIYIQTARDIPATTDPAKIADVRSELDAKRAAAIQKFMASQPAFAPVAYEVLVHDAAVPAIAEVMAGNAYRGSVQGYKGNVSGGGTGVLGTGGGGGSVTAPPTTGGGTFGSSNFGTPGGGTGGTGGPGGTGR
jgi:hypothetical protein